MNLLLRPALLVAVIIGAFLCISREALAQPNRGGGAQTNGRIYGKVIDGETRKGLEYAVVQVYSQLQGDTAFTTLAGGGLTGANGDFDVTGLPVRQPLQVKISLVGYEPLVMPVRIEGQGASAEKDLGNLRLLPSATLGTVVIEDELPEMRLEFDKRIFEVDKNPANAGGTAEDVLRNIPSITVDTDGNVSLRNQSPQIFVDGRPTNLTIDQIPADAIQRVEIITNPSARYDASGGGGGIVNIIMKHNRSMGYSGSVRAGVDMRGRMNGGLELNARQNKINFFLNGNYNQRKSISTGYTDRLTNSTPQVDMHQDQTSTNTGFFASGKIGFDWFMDNRNTITLSQSLNTGAFRPFDEISILSDTLDASDAIGSYNRISDTERIFRNWGSSLLYKHLFAEEGHELTGDVNVNFISSDFTGNYRNEFGTISPGFQLQEGGVSQLLLVSQVDYSRKKSDKFKYEFGVRASVRDYASEYQNFTRTSETEDWTEISSLQVNYHYVDQVYAAYGTASFDRTKWKYQLGLRAESSDYSAELIDTTLKFRNTYPLSFFPSLYLTRVISEKQDVQLALTRRISRPSFMQLSPFTDYSDSLNVSRGNPSLRPEFTHVAELSYQLLINKKNTFIASGYFRYTTDLTIRQQYTEYSDYLGYDIVINSYENASNSSAMGLEFISRNSINDRLDLTTNLNLYQSAIDGTNIDPSLKNNINSWWVKLNASIKLPQQFTFQIIADYSSRRALEVGSGERGSGIGGGRGGGGGMMGWNTPTNTVQGYVLPNYGVDLSFRKEFFKDKSLVFTFSIQDVLRTRINQVHSESAYFVQDTFRRRDPQLWRVNLSWRFGKVDSALFKRRNSRQSNELMEG